MTSRWKGILCIILGLCAMGYFFPHAPTSTATTTPPVSVILADYGRQVAQSTSGYVVFGSIMHTDHTLEQPHRAYQLQFVTSASSLCLKRASVRVRQHITGISGEPLCGK